MAFLTRCSVAGYPAYEITPDGRVFRAAPGRGARLKEKQLTISGSGYHVVQLHDGAGRSKTFLVHRLVALTFIGSPPPGRTDINHIDGNKTNNHVSNLEWCDNRHNILHAYRAGLRRPSHKGQPPGEAHSNAKLTAENVQEIRALRASGLSTSAIAKRFRLDQSTVSRISNPRSTRPAWKHLRAER